MRKRYIRLFETYEKVKEISEDYQLITDSQEIRSIGKQIGMPDVEEFPSLFVLQKDGNYKYIYGCYSLVPKLEDPVTRIY
jgi:mannose-1-phosphate guanylyltransferase